MTGSLIAALAILTFVSRAAALVLLPRPSPRLERLLMRVPGPLFAGFAAISLVTTTRDPADAETFAAVLAAVLAARSRSLLLVLAAGVAGYVLVAALRAVP
jgi:hypothetical protein